jgi:hypothetical protein
LDSPKLPENNSKQTNTFVKYAGFGAEMAAGILIPTLVGYKIDERLGNEKIPVFTLLLAAFGLIYVFYRLYKFSNS